MTPTRQTIFGADGNCMNACLATVLDIPLDAVPYPLNDDTAFLPDKLNVWLATMGLAYIEFPWGPMVLAPDTYCIATGPADRGFDHAVVCEIVKEGEGLTILWVHDPHPDDTFLHEIKMLGFFVPTGSPGQAARSLTRMPSTPGADVMVHPATSTSER